MTIELDPKYWQNCISGADGQPWEDGDLPGVRDSRMREERDHYRAISLRFIPQNLPPMLDRDTAHSVTGFLHFLTRGLELLTRQHDPFWCFEDAQDAFLRAGLISKLLKVRKTMKIYDDLELQSALVSAKHALGTILMNLKKEGLSEVRLDDPRIGPTLELIQVLERRISVVK